MSSSTLAGPQTIVSWTNALAHALEACGIKSRDLFEKAGIPYPSTGDPKDRIETRKLSALLHLAVEATNDPCFGLKLVPYLHAANFQALGYSLFCSSTLHEFCLRIVRFFKLIGDGVQHHLEEEEDAFLLTLEINSPDVSDELVDAWVGAVVHFCRSIYRPDFSPQRIKLTRSRPPSIADEFEQFFNTTVVFSADSTAVYFDKNDMFAPLPAGNKELARRNDEVVIEHLARLDRNNIIRQVEASIIELLPTGECSRDKIAVRLNMSPRSLLNKLEKKNTSYKEILESLRSNLARQYIEQKDMPITEITFLLGFLDTSSFSRAFRRWTGKSPTEYRQEVFQPGDTT
jgi:AraC-like DNA-binding protein